jgi:hypothetical protein
MTKTHQSVLGVICVRWVKGNNQPALDRSSSASTIFMSRAGAFPHKGMEGGQVLLAPPVLKGRHPTGADADWVQPERRAGAAGNGW